MNKKVEGKADKRPGWPGDDGEIPGAFEDVTPTVKWHALSTNEMFERTLSSPEGLRSEEADKRLREFGPNSLPSRKPPSTLRVFFRQFLSPLIYVLLAAGAVALSLGDLLDSAFIFVVLLINAVIGTIQEAKAEKSAEQLQRLIKTATRVRRNGAEEVVPAEDLVPGDVVLLESGNRVPADIRLLTASNLSIDESLITGESVPTTKRLDVLPEDTDVGDRQNMAFAGSTVATGRGAGCVVTTGSHTEIGAIAKTVSTTEMTKPPLLIRLEKFARQVSYIVLGAAALLAVFAVVRGIPLIDVFFMAVALAVSAIPEGLPVAVTVALAIRVTRMSKRNVLTRRLAAVESLGSCTAIATDKTGTLTVNRQTVKILSLPQGGRLLVSGEGYTGEGGVTDESGGPPPAEDQARLGATVEAGIICNEGSLSVSDGQWRYSGDAVDIALLAVGHKFGLEPDDVRSRVRQLGQIPFESERRYAANFYAKEEERMVAVKGAVEVVLSLSDKMLARDGEVPIDPRMVEDEASRLSSNGYRVLAIARGRVEGDIPAEPSGDDIPPLTFLGLIGLIDPPRPGVREAVEKCNCAGIRTIMVTGDHPATALAIAKELGIASSWEQVITGRELDRIGSPEVPEFLEAVKVTRVFARVTPTQKLEIVDALIRLGNFVAVTGDGVNDAPALRKANIGVAMGSGTDVAKDASSIIVTDDNFATIVSGVEEGRYAYENIRRVTYLLISTGVAEIVLFILSLTIGVTDENGVPILPLLAIQLLWLNVVTNGVQHVALAMEGGDPSVMYQPPRSPAEGVFNQLMVQEVVVSAATMGVMAFSLFYVLNIYFGYAPFEATNLTFLLMVLLENIHVFNCRSERKSAFKIPVSRNYLIIVGVFAAQGIHILAMYIPIMQEILRIQPVSFVEWLSLLLFALLILLVMEVFKLIKGGSKEDTCVVMGE